MFAGLAFAALAAVPFFAQAQAQFAKPEDAVKFRKAAFTLIGAYTGRIGAVVKEEKPYDKASVEADAALLETLSKLPWQAFVPNTTTDSKAKPEIWTERDKFNGAAEKMQAEVAKLNTAAKSGDLKAIKAAFGGVGQSCKSCHDNYRNK
nr:cytochrome c [Noviherbaspirillum humi]